MSLDAAACGAVATATAVVWRVEALLCEVLFYSGVAALWLVIIQWDLLDRWLGGPGAFPSIQYPIVTRSSNY